MHNFLNGLSHNTTGFVILITIDGKLVLLRLTREGKLNIEWQVNEAILPSIKYTPVN